jgi:acyl-CoA synthetase (AMP-forming)/AMP-acid ligase II
MIWNAGAFHDEWASLYPDDTALIFEPSDEHITYGELTNRINQSGNAIADLDVGREEKISFFFPNSLQFIYASFGAARQEIIPVLINYERGQKTIDYMVDNSDSVAILTVSKPTGMLEKALLAAQNADVSTVGIVTDDVESAVANVDVEVPDDLDLVPFETRMAEASTTLPVANVDPDKTAFIQYTSGTTGKPKGIELSHTAWCWTSKQVKQCLLVDDNDRMVTAAPMYHGNAWCLAVYPVFMAGASSVIMEEFDVPRIIRAIDKYEITCLTGVPAMFKMIVNDTETLSEYDVTSLNWGVLGSASVPEPLMVECQEVFDGIDMIEGYGLMEALVVAFGPRFGVNKLGSTGPTFPGCEARIIDPETGEELPANEVGECIISNPVVETSNYYRLPEKEDEIKETRDGRLFIHTDDLMKKDEDGYLYHLNRLDDMMVVGGKTVYPTEVEDLLQDHPGIADAAVLSASHETKGEAPVAFVVTQSDLTEEEIQQYTIDNGAAFAHPRRVHIRESLPLTGARKLDYQALEEELEEILPDGL